MTRNNTPYSAYELDLIHAIPSNNYIAYLTGRRSDTISTKRRQIGATRSRSFGLKHAKKQYKDIYLEIAKNHNIDVSMPRPKQHPVKKQSTVKIEHYEINPKFNNFVTVEINGISTIITNGDKISAVGDHVSITRSIC